MPSRSGLAVVAVTAVLGLVACTAAAGDVGDTVTPEPSASVGVPERPRPVLGVDRHRQSAGVVAAGGGDAPYNYAPTLMADAGRYRMWWCSQLGVAAPPGDDLLVAESVSLDGPFVGVDGSAGTPVFSGSGTGFDGMHTCDPSVIRVADTYYLYYTGAAGDHANGNSIGVATSPDGRVWTRANGGKPIVTASLDRVRDNIYGAGQPAAVHLDGWFYLMFTDTTGRDAGWNGAGQFVLRSPNPTFATGVEILSPGGFRRFSGTHPRLRSVVDAFSVDLMWVGALAAFAIAHETDGGTTITFWDKEFRSSPYKPVLIPGPWQEGPGLVRDPEGHAPRSGDDPCDRVPIDLVRATRTAAAPTDLVRFGADITGSGACLDPARVLPALDGFAMPSPQRTVDLVLAGQVVRIERRAVAERLAVRVLDQRVPALDAVPVAARLSAGAKAIRTDFGVGLVLDDKRLWAIPDPTVARVNSSPVAQVTQEQWDAYDRGPNLIVRR
ncbi:beta-xylosidase [Actinokineospora sp.]|uniref:beta-xylosidase n=1 Tax=Actinokineospora sp. TaxID=1872133 RepID=UPI0040381E9B